MRLFCDRARHLVCHPFSIANLHAMAQRLGIKRRWFHGATRNPHYDIPVRMIPEVTALCEVVDTRTIVRIIHGGEP